MKISEEGLRLIRSEKFRQRFWSKIAISDDNKCWLWTAKAKLAFGYGAINVRGTVLSSHRLAYFLTHETIPDGAHVLHTCDVPSCCNPNHLYAGTDAQNKADMVSRGRQRKGGHSEETRAKIRAAIKANPPRKTEKARLARSAALKKRWQDPEWRSRFSSLMSGERNHMFGKPPSEKRMEAIIRAAKARRGYRHSEATKQKMRAAALVRGTSE